MESDGVVLARRPLLLAGSTAAIERIGWPRVSSFGNFAQIFGNTNPPISYAAEMDEKMSVLDKTPIQEFRREVRFVREFSSAWRLLPRRDNGVLSPKIIFLPQISFENCENLGQYREMPFGMLRRQCQNADEPRAKMQPIPRFRNRLVRCGFSVNLTADRKTNHKQPDRNRISKLFQHNDLPKIANRGAPVASNSGSVETLRANWQADNLALRASAGNQNTFHPTLRSRTQT